MKTDEELIAAMAGGDREALETLYRRHGPWLAGRFAAATSSRDLAEEALQDTFLAAWRGAKSFRGEGDVGAWLWGIGRRRLISLTRKSSGMKHALPDLDLPGVDELIVSRDESDEVRAAVSRLPQPLREAIEKVVLEEAPLAEVAARLNIPVGTLKSRLHRARSRLRLEMEQ